MHGARLRLRPIIMTACATIFALIPMALGVTGGSAFISKSLAIVVIGGLVSSTLLTLLLVPALFVLYERRGDRRQARRERRDARRAARAGDGSASGEAPDAELARIEAEAGAEQGPAAGSETPAGSGTSGPTTPGPESPEPGHGRLAT